jgi:hypothetical protein
VSRTRFYTAVVTEILLSRGGEVAEGRRGVTKKAEYLFNKTSRQGRRVGWYNINMYVHYLSLPSYGQRLYHKSVRVTPEALNLGNPQ